MKKLLLALALFLLPISAEAANRFAVCTAACTWDGASTAMWSTATGGATGASVPGSADTVILDAATCVGGVTCTITVNTAVNVTSITMGACTGATTGCILDFSANNNTVTVQTFSGTGTGTRTLNMGNGAWTLTGTGSIWDYTATTNLTHNRNGSSIASTGTSNQRTFIANGKSFGAITLAANSGGSSFSFSTGGGTFAGLSATAPLKISFQAATTFTFDNAFTISGTSSNLFEIDSSSSGSGATISVGSGTASFSWAAIRFVSFTGGATFSATNSFDVGGNTGITITNPSTGGGRIIGG